MSIAVLHQVFDETRRLAIAGSNLAQDDFRLKKLIPPLEKAGKKAPVFAKVAAAAQQVIEAKPKDSANALLELSGLVMAILYTQGELGASGKLTPVKPVGVELARTQTPARLLKPVIEALTSTGSGRMETIREAHERGAFKDPRLVNHAIGALDDVYGELADFMEKKVVRIYGRAIVPLIENRINLSGRGGDARRLRLLHHLDAAKARPLVLEAFEKGSKEMKLAGLSCLGDSPDDLQPLMEQAVSKTADVRRTAIRRLMNFDQPQVIDLLMAALDGKDAGEVSHFYRGSKSKKLLKSLVDRWKAACDGLLALEVKARMKPAEKKEVEQQLGRLLIYSYAMPYRSDATVEKCVARVIEERDSLVVYKGKYQDGGDLVSWAAQWCAICGKTPLKKKLASLHDDLPEVAFDECVRCALEVLSPKEFYDTFAPIYKQEPPNGAAKRSKRELKDRSQMVENALESSAETNVWYDPLYDDDDFDQGDDYDDEDYHLYPRRKTNQSVQYDSRWIEDAIADAQDDLLLAIATQKDKPALDYLETRVRSEITKKKEDLYTVMHMIKKLAMCKHKNAADLVLETLKSMSEFRSKAKKQPRYGYGSIWWLGAALPHLSAAQCNKIRDSLEGMHETIIDEMLVGLQSAEELRAKQKKNK